MTQSNSETIKLDHSFSVFALGLVVGAVGALLLGTKEGRKFSEELLKSLPDLKIKKDDLLEEAKETLQETGEKIEKIVSPPPLPNWPSSSHSRPQYFTQNKDQETNW